MNRRLSVGVMTVALAATLGVVALPQAAGAASTFEVLCPMEVSFGFSSGLGINPTVGTASQSYFGGCEQAGASANTSPLLPPPISQSLFVNIQSTPFNTSGGYSGSCLLASVGMGFWPGHNAILVGGTVLVGFLSITPTIQFGEVYELTPLLAPCLQSSGLGGGVAWGAGASA